MHYSINEFAQIIGLTVHTLRYYEKENLLKPTRLSNGHRVYTEQDTEWVQFILRLKETGMPIKKIKDYAVLRAQGSSTAKERKVILEEHHEYVDKRICEWIGHREKLAKKIKFYESMCQ